MQNDSKTVLLTGASGFFGSHIREGLEREGFKIRTPYQDGRRLDLRNPFAVLRIRGQVDIVIHAAAVLNSKIGLKTFVDNIWMTLLVGLWAQTQHVSRFVFISSMSIHDGYQLRVATESSPLKSKTAYGRSKIIGEKIIRLLMPDAFIARFPYLCGPRDSESSLPKMIRTLSQGAPLSTRAESRDYLHVSDAVRAILAMCNYLGPQRVFCFGTGQNTGMVDLALNIKKSLRSLSPIIIKGTRSNPTVDYSLALQELGWRPEVPFDLTLRKLIKLPQELAA